MRRIAGVDGCPGGWLCIVLDTDSNDLRVAIFHTAAELLAHDPAIRVMAIDMPIGLVSAGRRRCDDLARTRLGERHVCVLNAPIRPALYAPSRLAASAITQRIANRQVGCQEWALYPKIINLDLVLTTQHQRWCFEIHPEVSFAAWNGGTPIEHDKHSESGRQARDRLIDAIWPGFRQNVLTGLRQQGFNDRYFAVDDVNDAFAALWTAQRMVTGTAQRIPDVPEIDDRGLRMEMWY